MRDRNRILRTLGLLALLIVAFLWGVAYARHYVFPYRLVSAIAAAFSEPVPEPAPGAASGGVSVRTASPFERIGSLPYVGSVDIDRAPAASGVVVHRPELAAVGLTLFTSGAGDEAQLIEMDGSLRHRWELPREQVWWDSPLAARQEFSGWRAATATPELELFAVFDYLGLVKLDRASRVEWIYRGGSHHDLWRTDDGRIFTLTYREERIPELNPEVSMLTDSVTVLDAEGSVVESLSLVRLLLASPYAYLLPSVHHLRGRHSIDLLHANSIQVFDGSVAERAPELFARGNILVSARNISTVLIIDPDARRILWAWGPSNIAFQHKARLLANGHILLFDNGAGDFSSVIELDPLSQRIVWQFEGVGPYRLRSRIFGAAQRLPGGNTLIVDSMQARALEVTAGGEVAWIFHTTPGEGGSAPVLFEMERYPSDYFTALGGGE